MHEIGILYKMMDHAEAVARENNVSKIERIAVEVGDLSGVLPAFLEKYYPIVIEGREILKDSGLLIQMVPGQALCDECQTLYNVMKNEGKCPRCSSRSKSILGGRDFVVKSIICQELG